MQTVMKTFKPTLAFTLMELLVVIAIISGLLMLALPNLHRYRRYADATHCKNNLRQYGIAMNQYMADNEGYFIYVNASGFGVTDSKDYAMGDYDLGVRIYGGKSGSVTHDWLDDFVASYVPDGSKVASAKFLRSSERSVRLCPEVDRKVFDAGDDRLEPPVEFKGFRTDTSDGEAISIADFEYGYVSNYFTLASYFTTYGINNYKDIYRKPRSSITNPAAIAFIDMNAEESWRAKVYDTNNVWMFTGRDRHGNPVNEQTPKSSTNRFVTEIGYYHPGTNKEALVANYIAIDGSVGSIASNEISLANFR